MNLYKKIGFAALFAIALLNNGCKKIVGGASAVRRCPFFLQ